MLAEITAHDISLGKSFRGDLSVPENEALLFVNSYERVARGLYLRDATFELLSRDLVKSAYPFDALGKAYWKRLHEDYKTFGDDKVHEDAGVIARRAEYRRLENAQNENYPNDYGVCDYPEQILEKFPKLAEDPRRFLIMFMKFSKKDQPSRDGWRWEKWGNYVGEQETLADYLADEPHIEQVYSFHIFELKPLPEGIEEVHGE